MSERHSSPDWYRIAAARPRLRADVRLIRHLYLGRPWYVLANRTGTRVHRLTPAAHALVGRLDGSATVAELHAQVTAELGTDAPGEDDIVRLLSQLHQADLIDQEETPLLEDLMERRAKDRGQLWKKLLLNPLSATLPLFDPARLLDVLLALVRPVPGLLWWLAALGTIAVALALLPLHWAALSNRGLEGFIDLENLGLIALVYPVVKAFHELGHGLATRARGGEVREMGLIFIAFYPMPYVEASSSLTFASKWDRAAVAAAGVAVELTIASLAFFLWIHVEPGTLRAILFNTMVISGLSTLLINGNPLLKFDGYHVLCDLIEIPNLGQRGNSWWGELARRVVFGTRERRASRMATTGWERLWFFAYPPAAFVWRLGVTLSIALFVAQTYRALGVVLAVWSVVLSLLWPAARTLHRAVTDARIRRAGRRALAGAVLVPLALAGLVFALPLPHYAVVEGVVWLPETATLRAPDTGIVAPGAPPAGTRLAVGAPVLRLDAPELAAEAAIAHAGAARLAAEHAAALTDDRARAARMEEPLAQARRAADRADARLAALDLHAGLPGQLSYGPGVTDPQGRFFARGAVIGRVLPEAGSVPVVRVAIPALLAEDLPGLRAVSLRYAAVLAREVPATLLRVVPEVAHALPSEALSLDGGGRFATLPGKPLESVDRLIQLDLAPAAPPPRPAYGMRALVRLDFAPSPLGQRALRALRRVFIGAFHV